MAKKFHPLYDHDKSDDLAKAVEKLKKVEESAKQQHHVNVSPIMTGQGGSSTAMAGISGTTMGSGHNVTGTSTLYNVTAQMPSNPQYQYQQIPSNPGITYVQYPQQVPPYQVQQYPYPPGFIPASDPALTSEEAELAIDFLENLMFMISTLLDECDVPNRGGTMDRNPGMRIEATIDLEEYEIILRPKTKV